MQFKEMPAGYVPVKSPGIHVKYLDIA